MNPDKQWASNLTKKTRWFKNIKLKLCRVITLNHQITGSVKSTVNDVSGNHFWALNSNNLSAPAKLPWLPPRQLPKRCICSQPSLFLTLPSLSSSWWICPLERKKHPLHRREGSPVIWVSRYVFVCVCAWAPAASVLSINEFGGDSEEAFRWTFCSSPTQQNFNTVSTAHRVHAGQRGRMNAERSKQTRWKLKQHEQKVCRRVSMTCE